MSTTWIDAAGGLSSRDELALDEVLLDRGEPVVRTYEFDRPAVVLGRSSRWRDETDAAYCRSRDVPILRRCTGGASVVGGPGCLMYAVVLSLSDHPGLTKIDAAHDYVMQRLLDAVRRQVPEAVRGGICDLARGGRKFSGNALRVTRRAVLYHGTILHGFDLDLLAGCLAFAPRQPDYRDGRNHRDFVGNVDLDRATLDRDLAEAFGVDGRGDAGALAELVADKRRERYDDPNWHRRH